MTNKKAIIELKKLFSEVLYPSSELVEAEDLAIRALESISQILWERNVAIDQLKMIGKGLGENMDDVVSEREKQIPKKPKKFNGKTKTFLICPVCGILLMNGNRCHNNQCGQKILWEIKEDDE